MEGLCEKRRNLVCVCVCVILLKSTETPDFEVCVFFVNALP